MRDEELDSKVKLMQEVVRTVRSLRQDYLPPKARPEGACGAAGWIGSAKRVAFELYPFSDFGQMPQGCCFIYNIYYIYTVYVVCKSDEAHAILTEFVDVSTTLSQCNK